jgi:hypothetical protein
VNVKWPEPYPLCHDSPDAYGQVVATQVEATFAQFGCTGATYSNGITAPEVQSGWFKDTTLCPAGFGDWDDQTDLNPEYDTAAPDLVPVSLGADDLMFVAILEACVENAYEHAAPDGPALECVPGNPGSTVENDFFANLPTLDEHYRTLVSWIKERGAKAGKVPKIVFTNYPDRLPPDGVTCNDTYYLNSAQVPYWAACSVR